MKKSLDRMLLLSCRSPFLDDAKIYAPMANLYLKSYINKNVPDVDVVLGDDEYELDNPDYFKPYDIIGLSVMTPQREEALKILHAVKRYDPDKVVVVGGPHVKHYAGDIIDAKEPYDWIVPLDGERVLTGILKGETDFNHQYIRTGIKWEDGKSQRIVMDTIDDPRILIDIMTKKDVDEAPRPDRSSKNAVKVIGNYHYKLGDRDSTTMMSARGCPEQCSFCEDAMTAVKWSSYDSINNQLDDIKNLGYGGVYMFDDLFAISMPKIRPITEQLSKKNLIYRCNAQARYFTKWGEDMAKLLSDTGCYEIAFGAETGSQKILDNIRKRTTVEANYQTIEYANKHDIIVKAFILLGLPGEDMETLKDTEKLVNFLMQDKRNDFGAYVFYPYKGTQLRDSLDRGEDPGMSMLVEEGLGAYGIKGGNTEAGVIQTNDLTNKQLIDFRDYLVNKYHPESGKEKWSKFHDTHMESEVEYER
ncbi:MAG: B12-binding domain-containing radical SAM protein [Bacteroidetes bacterium]|nr:B12-binding domain-containing radical SAM protein [Bacteroidota bacterium]